jgi:hypothetical protein
MKKGETLNPHGRPKKLASLDKLLPEVLGDEIDDNSAIKAILDKLVEKAKKGDIRAAEILLDRGWGKPKQSIQSDSKVDVTFNVEEV